MAIAAQAALLDELMGKYRNEMPDENRRNMPEWQEEDVCKFFLCGFCPNELFTNTKADLGPCQGHHDERLREMYKKSDKFEQMGYEKEFVRHLNNLIADVERRIRRGHARLNLNSTMANPNGMGNVEKEEHLATLTKQINELVEEAEKLGTEGSVEQAQEKLKLCEQLRNERSELDQEKDPNNTMSKELEVCDICGAFRIRDDAPQRVEEHLIGKMHIGYALIRDYIRDYEEKRSKRLEEYRLEARQHRDSRSSSRHHSSTQEKDKRSRSRDRSSRRSREKDRRSSRDRDSKKDKDKQDKYSSRDKDRNRHSHDKRSSRDSPSRSKDKRESSKDRDKHSSKHDRSNNKDNSGSRGDRSSEKKSDRDRKSRDGDRDRQKEKDKTSEKDKDRSTRNHNRKSSRDRDKDKERSYRDKERSYRDKKDDKEKSSADHKEISKSKVDEKSKKDQSPSKVNKSESSNSKKSKVNSNKDSKSSSKEFDGRSSDIDFVKRELNFEPEERSPIKTIHPESDSLKRVHECNNDVCELEPKIMKEETD